jgi:hypothetical protein
MQQFVTRLGEVLTTALEDASSLEIATYVSDQIAEVKFENDRLSGGRLPPIPISRSTAIPWCACPRKTARWIKSYGKFTFRWYSKPRPTGQSS